MRKLYPDIHPYAEHMIAVDERHTLYVEESGNAHGIPVLFVHGGPGGGTSPAHRSFLRSGKIPNHPVRPARLWPLPAPRRTDRQPFPGSGGRYGSNPRHAAYRSVDVVWRLLGLYP